MTGGSWDLLIMNDNIEHCGKRRFINAVSVFLIFVDQSALTIYDGII